jgi:hypothetical protein
MPYEAPESVRCDCCGNDVGRGEHDTDCVNEPIDLLRIESLHALCVVCAEADDADEAARINALAARHGFGGGL